MTIQIDMKPEHNQPLILDVAKALKSGVFLSGTSGCGKSNLGFHIADRLMKAGAIVYVFDPSQAWMKGSSIQTVLTVSEQTPQLSFPSNASAIFDISRLYIPIQRKTVEHVCKGIFNFQVNKPESLRRNIFLMFEESQIYLQQNSMRSKDCQEVMRIVTVGRNFRLRFCVLTQYPSTIDKLCIKSSEQRYWGSTSEYNDKKYIESFIGKEVNQLQDLEVGEFLYNSGSTIKKIFVPLFREPENVKVLSVNKLTYAI